MENVSDWLYQIIFHRVTELWAAINEQGDEDDPPPSRIDIREYAGFDREGQSMCTPPVLHAWKYDADGLQSVLIPSTVEIAQGRRVMFGMFYEIGTVHFHVMEDHQHIVLEDVVGPKYGSGYVYKVIGQGADAKLEVDLSFPMWDA